MGLCQAPRARSKLMLDCGRPVVHSGSQTDLTPERIIAVGTVQKLPDAGVLHQLRTVGTADRPGKWTYDQIADEYGTSRRPGANRSTGPWSRRT